MKNRDKGTLVVTKEASLKEFASYAAANVLAMSGISLYVLADTFFIAKGLSSDGLAALNLTIPLYNFMQGLGMMVGMGGATGFAIQKSQGNRKEGNVWFTRAIILMLVLDIILVLTGIFLSGHITRIMGGDEVTYDMCFVYIKTLYIFSPGFLLNYVLLCFVRNDGAPKRAMVAMLVGSLVNIILDYIFIFPLEMGMFGAVLATGVSPLVSIMVLLPFFIKKQNTFHLDIKNSIPGIIAGHGKIISLGIPAFISEASAGVVILVFNKLILNIEGNIGVAAYSVVANVSLVVLAIYTGIAEGIQPLFSRNYGRGAHEANRTLMKYAIYTVLVLSIICYGVIFLYAEGITQIFNEEQNQVLQEIAVTGLRIYFVGAVFAGCNVVFANYFTAVNQPKPGAVISMLRGLFLIVLIAVILASLYGMTGVWLTFPVTELLVCIVSGTFLLSRRVSRCHDKRNVPKEKEK